MADSSLQNNKIFLAKTFNLVLSTFSSSFEQTKRKSLSKIRQNISGPGSFAKKGEIEIHVHKQRLT